MKHLQKLQEQQRLKVSRMVQTIGDVLVGSFSKEVEQLELGYGKRLPGFKDQVKRLRRSNVRAEEEAGWSGSTWVDHGWSRSIWVDHGWSGSTWADLGWSGLVWADMGWPGLIWVDVGLYGLMWVDLGWSGLMWFSLGWCPLIWAGLIWPELIWIAKSITEVVVAWQNLSMLHHLNYKTGTSLTALEIFRCKLTLVSSACNASARHVKGAT